MRRLSLSLLSAVAVAALVLQGCQDAPQPLSPTPTLSATAAEPTPLVPRLITPQVTDPAIDWVPAFRPEANHHYVWLDRTLRSNPKLLVFLPGFEGKPRCCQLFEQEAARLGYHVIGLMWENEWGIGTRCAASSDPDCSGKMRLEAVDGIDRSPFIATSRANSIDNRLTKLLLYLDAQYPGEGWSRFLEDGAPKWSQIAVAGQSLGAGQAALIGTIRHVDRVIMISGPAPEGADPWSSIGKTPSVKYFQLAHLRDHNTEIAAHVSSLGLDRFGPAVAPELSAPPYSGSHVLVTDLEPVGGYVGIFPHISTAVDVRVARDAYGVPLLRDAWRYLLGEPPHGGR